MNAYIQFNIIFMVRCYLLVFVCTYVVWALWARKNCNILLILNLICIKCIVFRHRGHASVYICAVCSKGLSYKFYASSTRNLFCLSCARVLWILYSTLYINILYTAEHAHILRLCAWIIRFVAVVGCAWLWVSTGRLYILAHIVARLSLNLLLSLARIWAQCARMPMHLSHLYSIINLSTKKIAKIGLKVIKTCSQSFASIARVALALCAQTTSCVHSSALRNITNKFVNC